MKLKHKKPTKPNTKAQHSIILLLLPLLVFRGLKTQDIRRSLLSMLKVYTETFGMGNKQSYFSRLTYSVNEKKKKKS